MRSRLNPLPALALSVLFSALASIALTLPRSWGSTRLLPVQDAIFIFLVGSVSLFLVLYVGRLVFGWMPLSSEKQLRICTDCFEINTVSDSVCRACGGVALEDLSGWTRNRCAHCGYDLRASTDLCPECGNRLTLNGD